MDKSTKKLIGTGAVFLFLFAILLGFLMLGEPDYLQKKGVKTELEKELPKQAPHPLPVQKEAMSTNPKNIAPNVVEAVLPSAGKVVTIEPSDPIAEILEKTELDFPTTVTQLLSILPKLNPDQQVEAAQHIANLSDDEVAKLWIQKITIQSLPQPAAEVLFNDMLNRPQEILTPFLSSIADNPQHPQAKQSVEILEVLYGERPAGTSWKKWVQMKLRESP